jgi:hypothetical protein
LRLKKRGLERNGFVFFDFFSKNQKKQTHFAPKGFKKKPFERADFGFLIFFCKKKTKKSKSALSAPLFFRRKKISEVPSI